MMIHPTLATELAMSIDALPKECYRNSVLAFVHFENHRDLYQMYFEGAMGAAHYVEGLLTIMEGALHIDHGWFEVGEVIVDVTLQDQQPEDYQPVLRYTVEEVWERVTSSQRLPFFSNNDEARKEMANATQQRYAGTFGR